MSYSHIRSDCDEVIGEGLIALQMSMGIVSHIDGDAYEIIAIKSAGNVFSAGEIFALQDTYCREVVENGDTVALTELGGKPGLCKHPLYSGLPLEVYISSPIFVNGKVWGTLNFSSMKIKREAFSEEEITYVKNNAEKISQLL